MHAKEALDSAQQAHSSSRFDMPSALCEMRPSAFSTVDNPVTLTQTLHGDAAIAADADVAIGVAHPADMVLRTLMLASKATNAAYDPLEQLCPKLLNPGRIGPRTSRSMAISAWVEWRSRFPRPGFAGLDAGPVPQGNAALDIVASPW
jgi:hypothetical protein